MLHMQNEYLDLLKIVMSLDEIEKASKFPGARISSETYGDKQFAYMVYREDGEQKKIYLGKYSSEFRKAAEAFSQVKSLQSERRKIFRDFKMRGYPELASEAQKVVAALAKNGFFRLRGVMIGTNAFLQYPAMYGEMSFFENKSELDFMATGDVDFGMFHSISIKLSAIDQKMAESFENTLKEVGDFQPHYDSSGNFSGRWIGENGFEVDLLTPFRRETKVIPQEREHDDRLRLENIGGIRLYPVKYLDFLIYDEMRAVALADNGILVNVPRPERFAIHKLIVSELRKEGVNGKDFLQQKKKKDILQATALIACLHEHDPDALKKAWMEANNRGPHWRTILSNALCKLPEEYAKILQPDFVAPDLPNK